MTKATRTETKLTEGTGSVFRDLGLDSPEEELSKAGRECVEVRGQRIGRPTTPPACV
jgi:hypothetical protein